ncbi:MAG TPA: winged helix-turn-helix transcriptional regulator [Thermoplasmata archaeon]|nr:winged helix-turn-helix transcriptional regulator [Thermoplasmata archaeon]
MDPLDLGILRELSRDQVLWFGRLDPRYSAAEMARRLRVDRATVSSRLHAWERQGFLRGHEVVPSPRVFGARVAGGNLRVVDLRRKPQVLEDLALVPGLVSAIDHLGPWVALLYVFETLEGLDRSRRLVAKLAGVGEVTPCMPFRVPEATVALNALDWRILQDLRRAPRRPIGGIARSVRLSTKTLARRLARMIRGRAVWYLPVLDFGRYTKATATRFIVTLRPNAELTVVSDQITSVIPGLSHLIDPSKVIDTADPIPSLLDVGAYVDSAAQAEDVQHELNLLDGVAEVEILFPRRIHLYRGWFDEHLEIAAARDLRIRPASGRNRRALGAVDLGRT